MNEFSVKFQKLAKICGKPELLKDSTLDK